jgi:hypothetical protein
LAVIRPQVCGERKLTEKFAERTAGIWVPLVFYAVGGIYMLAFWSVFSINAYHLVILGAASILIAVALYALSRWAFWLGLFTFPLFLTEFGYALASSVDFVGWYPNIPTTAFHASMIVYMIFLVFSLILLIDKRNTLKTDRILDRLHIPVPTTPKAKENKS